MKIAGGYYIKARVIKTKSIAHAPPHVREVWDYLLREANYCDGYCGGNKIKRGQLFRTYTMIREALAWFIGWRKMMYNENQMKATMKYLRKYQMITTRKALGGVLITVINYDVYQNPNNYENPKENPKESTSTNQTQEPSYTDINKKKKKKKNGRKKKTYLETSDEFRVAEFLYHNILKHKPDYKQPDLQKWAAEVDFMLRIDKRSLDTAKKMIVWVQSDVRERIYTMSTKSLRKNFDMLEIKMDTKKPSGQTAKRPKRSIREILEATLNEDGSINESEIRT